MIILIMITIAIMIEAPRCLLPIMVRERGSPTLFVAYFTEGG